MTKRPFRVIVVALGLLLLTVTQVSAQWPTTCVGLNDIVEAHLSNDGNVGIYQRAFQDQAEQACQNDHRDDVRSVFAWALGLQADESDETEGNWVLRRGQDPISGKKWVQAQRREFLGTSQLFGEIRSGQSAYVFYQDGGDLSVGILSNDYILGYPRQRIKVEYRFDSAPAVTQYWTDSPPDHEYVWTRGSQAVSFARNILQSQRLVFRATGYNFRSFFRDWDLVGSDDPNHPIRTVLKEAGYSVPPVQGWPTTCVDLNDIVEAHLGNDNNVGIYQRVYGSAAEAGCQRGPS